MNSVATHITLHAFVVVLSTIICHHLITYVSLCYVLFYFTEFVCPSIGFLEFLTPESLNIILDGQGPSGCYKVGSITVYSRYSQVFFIHVFQLSE